MKGATLSILTSLLALVVASCGRAPTAPERGDVRASSLSTAWARVRTPDDLALLEAPARALADASSVERVSATYPLRVVQVHVAAGDDVEAGAPIVTVSSASVLSAAAEHESARRRLEVERARLAELRALRGDGYTTTERVFELERQERALEATLRVSGAALRAADLSTAEAARTLARGALTLRAHVSGVVRDVRVVRGDVLLEGGTFATIVSGRSGRVEARFTAAPPTDARFEFEDLAGRRTSLDAPMRVTDGGDQGGVIAWFAVPIEGVIVPFAEGHVHVTLRAPEYVAVPATAVIASGDGRVVLRRRGRDVARVPVTVVTASGATAVVRGDVHLGDEVATDGDAAQRTLEAP